MSDIQNLITAVQELQDSVTNLTQEVDFAKNNLVDAVNSAEQFAQDAQGAIDDLVFGDLTELNSDVLTISGGTESVFGSGVSIEVKRVSETQDGFLSSSDFGIFSNKQDAIILTTDGTSGAATLSGSTLNIPQYSGTNIYNNDGILSTDRTVSLSGNTLTISGETNTTFFGNGDLSIGNDLDVSGSTRLNGDTTIVNVLLSNQENLDIDSTIPQVVAQVSSTIYSAAFFDYYIKNGSNLRAGRVYAVHNGTNVEFTETSTADLGNTSGVTLGVDLSGENIRLLATATTDNWIIKSLVTGI
jgi:hypothetical protein